MSQSKPLYVCVCVCVYLKVLFTYFQKEGKEGKKRGRETSIGCLLPPTQDLAHNPGMCPKWESNW